MPLAPKVISGVSEAAEKHDFQYYVDLAAEICRRVENKAHLSDDEIIILSIVASQLVLAKYMEPGDRDSDDVLNKILSLLDRGELNDALMSKMVTMLSDYAPQSRTRNDAPSGQIVKQLGIEDVEEPAADPDPRGARQHIKEAK
jgi:hypothetical protein